jgi:hypothetical protein
MKLRLIYTNGLPPGADELNEKLVRIELRVGNFEKFFEDDFYRRFKLEMYDWIGGRYSTVWDIRNPNPGRLGVEGAKFWRFAWSDWSIHLFTMIVQNGALHSVIEDAVVNNARFENYKIRPKNGSYSSGRVKNGGTTFNSDTPIYWVPVND